MHICLVIVVSILTVSLTAIYLSESALKKTRLDALESIADLKVNKIETFFTVIRRSMQTAQNFYNIRKNLPILNQTFNNKSDAHHLNAERQLDSQLKPLTKINEFVDVMLVNPKGLIVYASNDEHKKKDVGHALPDGGRAFEVGRSHIYMSHVFMDKVTDDIAILMTAPVYDFNQTFIGVIAFEMNLKPLYAFVQDITGLGETGETLIGEKTGDKVLFLNSLRHDPDAALKKVISIGDHRAIPAQQASSGKNGSGIVLDYRSEKVLAAWRYISSLNWGLVAKIDMSEVMAPINKLKINIILISIITLSFFLMLSYLFSRRNIVDPIQKLVQVTHKIGQGDLTLRAEPTSKDEIGQLAQSFNHMTDNIIKLKEEFNGILSHEIKSPLSIIKGFVENLRGGLMGSLSLAQQEALMKISKNIDRVNRLTTRILMMYRLESGKINVKMDALNLSEFLLEMIKNFEVLAVEKNLKLEYRPSCDLPLIYADSDLLYEVLNNLFSNALRYAKSKIVIKVQRIGQEVQVSVYDDGCGISKEDQGRLFNRFQQLKHDVEHRDSYKGTGLGLALCKDIVAILGGKTGVESTVGEGSKFYFTLPLRDKSYTSQAA